MKKLIYILVGILIGATSYFVINNLLPSFSRGPDVTVSTHNIVVEQVESLGKMELVKHSFQDVITHEVIREWLPDPSIMLFVKGEAIGCIDFTQIDSTDILIFGDTLVISLPEPEICYAKLDHSQSRVFSTRNTFFEEASLVDAAYKEAEKQIFESALKSEILQETRLKASDILVPILETITGKKVVVRVKMQVDTNTGLY